MNSSVKFVIQARTGSQRMPGKSVRPFFREKNIVEIITDNLIAAFGREHIILATTDSRQDDVLEVLGRRAGVEVFRGSEQNVLKRFVDAVAKDQPEWVIRICADNPFLMPDLITPLLQEADKGNADYVSYNAGQKLPVIRSHWGLFTEVVRRSALEKALQLTEDPFFLEHVTNYVYGHPETFRVQLIDLPAAFTERKDYRFTIDTEEDFNMQRELYLALFERYHTQVFTPEQLFRYIDATPGLKSEMEKQITRHAK